MFWNPSGTPGDSQHVCDGCSARAASPVTWPGRVGTPAGWLVVRLPNKHALDYCPQCKADHDTAAATAA